MKSETQALHLAKMMQKYIHTPEYELALPFVRIRKSILKKLSVNDVLLLDVNVLEFILVEDNIIYADLALQHVEGNYEIVVTHLHNKAIVYNESRKYETLKLSFGKCEIKSFEVGKCLKLSLFDLEKIMLISDGEKIAEGSLVNVDNELGLKINIIT